MSLPARGAILLLALLASASLAASSGKPEPGSGVADLRAPLLGATVKAIELEIEAYQARLETARGGAGLAENVARFEQKLAALRAEREQYGRMKPEEYPTPVETGETGSILDASTEYGPILPPTLRQVTLTVEDTFRDGSLLTSVDGTSRSGPFFHLAGISGGGYGALAKGRRYTLTIGLVYRREYFGTIGDYYVYVADVRQN